MKIIDKRKNKVIAFRDLEPKDTFRVVDEDVPYMVVEEIYGGSRVAPNAVSLLSGWSKVFNPSCKIIRLNATLLIED